MNNLKVGITAGFAMFAMFFGSGNLVFPIFIGRDAEGYYLAAFSGLFLSGVIVPFLGIVSMILYDGDMKKYFSSLGKYVPLILTSLMLFLIGPFGVTPRCILVGYAGMQLLVDMPLYVFSFVYCIAIGIMIWKHEYLVGILGKYFTPFLLAGVFAIIIAGLMINGDTEIHSEPSIAIAKFGFQQGYQMMDLIAAFFFGVTTIMYLKNNFKGSKKEFRKICTIACLIGASLLSIVYLMFVYIGSKFALSLANYEIQDLLIQVAARTLGAYASPISAITIIIATLTTAVVLVILFADFLVDISNERLNNHTAVVISLIISYVMSLLGFTTILIFLATILQVLYPALIALTIGAILDKKYNVKTAPYLFWGISLIAIFLSIM